MGLAAFEGIAVGIARNLANIQRKANPVDYLRQRIEVLAAPDVEALAVTGLRGTMDSADGSVWSGVVFLMSKPYTEDDLSSILDTDLIGEEKSWLSDMKAAIKIADLHSKPALLRAIIAMSYAHWEVCANMCKPVF